MFFHRGPDRSRPLWIVLAALIGLALAVRTWNLGGPSITHPEMYAPGIAVPAFATEPIERSSVAAIVRSSLLTDNHPPGYYLLVLPWSKTFGASLASLRLPSALLGTLTVALLFAAAWRWEGRAVAVMSATWLMLHGHHVLWSRSARMWVLCAAMATLSAWALSELHRGYRSGWATLYVGSLVVGLWSEYTFWPILAAQVLGEILGRTQSRALPPTVKLQALAITLSSPIFVFLLSRLGSSAYLESPVGGHLWSYLAFASWFDMAALRQTGAMGTALSFALVLSGAILVAAGAWKRTSTRPHNVPVESTPSYLRPLLWISLLWPAALVWLWRDEPMDPNYPVKTLTIALAVAVVIVTEVAARYWEVLRHWLVAPFDRSPLRHIVADITVLHAVVPFTILALASVVMPALAPRSTLAMAPFVIFLASQGLTMLTPQPLARAAALGAILLCGSLSTYLYTTETTARDYKGLALAIERARRPGDLLAVENRWYAEPIHYYLRPDSITSVAAEELDSDRLAAAGPERMWVLGFGPNPELRVATLTAKLRGYRQEAFVSATNAGAGLFVRIH